MSPRVTALTVVLEGEPRDEDVADLLAAIRRLRGVADVAIVDHTLDLDLATWKAKLELSKRVYTALGDIFKSS